MAKSGQMTPSRPSLSMYYTRTNTVKEMDLKLPKMLCKDSKQRHVMFHELNSVSSLLCTAKKMFASKSHTKTYILKCHF